MADPRAVTASAAPDLMRAAWLAGTAMSSASSRAALERAGVP